MTLQEALEAVGVGVEVQGMIGTPTTRSYGNERDRGAEVQRGTLLAQFGSFRFLVVPLTIYLEGDIAEEWCVSAGSPPETPRTIFLLRDDRWVFLSRARDPQSNKWPVISFADKFQPGVSRGSEGT